MPSPRVGARIVGPLPGQTLLALADEAARRASIEIAAVGQSMVKQSLLQDTDSRGFIGRADTGLAHDLVATTAPERTATGWRTTVGIAPPRDAIAGVLEAGRRPGKRMPPVAAIEPWVRRNLRDAIAGTLKGARPAKGAKAAMLKRAAIAKRKFRSGTWTLAEATAFARGLRARIVGVKTKALDAAIHSRAFMIARAIGRKGTPGLGMFRKAAAVLRDGKAAAILRSAWHRTLAAARGDSQ